MIKAGIIGANGYTGFELLKILAEHKGVETVHCASRSNAGTNVSALYPALGGFYKDLKFCEPDPVAAAKECDVVFTALPHAASAQMGMELIKNGTRVIDLSADFRYDDVRLYEKTYKVEHPCPQLNDEAVYGLTELNRDKVKNCRIVGNPGCYTTASILPLYPLIKEGLISPDGIIIDAKSGTSGAGRKAETDYSFCEVTENFKAYGVTTHRHTSEIEEKLSQGSQKVALSFTPHLLPVKRGILATIYANTSAAPAKISAAYEKYYGGEQFVRFFEEGVMPELKWVTGSNMCCIGFKTDPRLNRVIIVSCLDNLVKGASGQAVQNMNVMFGFDEAEGLKKVAQHL